MESKKKEEEEKATSNERGTTWWCMEREKVVGWKNVNEKGDRQPISSFRPIFPLAPLFFFFFFFFQEAASGILLGQLRSRCRDNNHC